MKTRPIFFPLMLLSAFTLSFFFSSCNKDKLPPEEEPEFCETLTVSYQLNIKPIVDTYCAYAGCHDGSSPGVYLTYDQMIPSLESGKITERAINNRDMPPPYANEGLTELPQEEFDLLNCWIAAGYPEE